MALVGDPMGGGSLVLYLLCRGLSIKVATRPVTPPAICTGPPPATSSTPRFRKNPALAQTQWEGKLHTNVFNIEKIMYASKRVLSTMAPETIVVAVVAKANWNIKCEYRSPVLLEPESTSKKKFPKPAKELLSVEVPFVGELSSPKLKAYPTIQ